MNLKSFINESAIKGNLPVTNITEMAYWDMSDFSYSNVEKGKRLDVQTTPDKLTTWQAVKVLDHKQTSTQAVAFKNGDQIVIAFRGSQEFKDWFDTDANYLVAGSKQTPGETRVKQEAMMDDRYNTGNRLPNRDRYLDKNLENPFDIAVKFVEEIRKEYPEATIDTTGHSLGGALATYVRVMATFNGIPIIRQTITYAAPNVYGMFPLDVRKQIDEGKFRDNPIDYTDPRDIFGTLNDRFPQVGVQHFVNNEKLWLGNHKSENFGHLFLSNGEIRLTPDTMRELANDAEDLYYQIRSSFQALYDFEEVHDQKIREIQRYFEGQIGYNYHLLSVSDVKEIMDKYSMGTVNGKPTFYDAHSREMLLTMLGELKNGALEMKENLQTMANSFEEKDILLANWLLK